MKKNYLNNCCINSDSYKQGHFKFMRNGTTLIVSYGEARSGSKYPQVVWFGLQMYLKEYLMRKVTQKMIDQADTLMTQHGLPFNREGWEYVLKNHNGLLPLKICAADEGTVLNVNNVLFTVENTDPKCAWASSFIETAILRAAWYGTTVATQSYEFEKVILEYLKKTGTPESLPFRMVDFSARGVESFEAAYICGAAHLVNFMGTDNIAGISATMDFYGAKEATGFSIPASEHSVTIETGPEGELQFFSDAIDTFLGPGKMVSLVVDSYSTKRALSYFGVQLKDKIINSGGTVVARPDSGVPKDMVLFVVKELEQYFGTTANAKGYKVLPDCIRVIQGDGISVDSIRPILENLTSNGYSADNVTFGAGGGLAQNVTRDTQRFAQKACHVVTNGVAKDIQKVPETDMTKASKSGKLALVYRDGVIVTVKQDELRANETNLLKVRYENGKLFNKTTFDKVRATKKLTANL